jgi:DnaJ-class molecular chaperone
MLFITAQVAQAGSYTAAYKSPQLQSTKTCNTQAGFKRYAPNPKYCYRCNGKGWFLSRFKNQPKCVRCQYDGRYDGKSRCHK